MPFYNQSDDHSNFVVGFTPDPKRDFGVFAKGYRLAADRLTAQLFAAPRFSDYEAYPVVFLYRHALELSLKHIIYASVDLAALKYLDDLDKGLQNTHDLRKLSQAATGLLTLLYPEDEFLKQISSVLADTCADLGSLDARSDAYRYPIDARGLRSTDEHTTVNLHAFATRMSPLLEDLDTIHFGLGGERYIAEDAYRIVQEALLSASERRAE